MKEKLENILQQKENILQAKRAAKFTVINSKIPRPVKDWGKIFTKLFLELIVITFLVFTIIFAITNAMDGDPKIIADAKGEKAPDEVILALENMLGVNDSWFTQYGNSLKGVFNGTFGQSWSTIGVSTSSIVLPQLMTSFSIGFIAIGLSIAMGVPIGIFLARREGKLISYASTFSSVIAFSIPSFIIALVLLVINYSLGLPVVFTYNSIFALLIPALAIAIPIGFGYSRHLRGSIKEEYTKQYVQLARVKGATESQVFRSHVFKPSLVPIVTYLPFIVISALTGVVTTEMVFAVPGSGSALVNAATQNDRNAILALSFFYTVVIILSFFTRDILLQFIDPKIRRTS